MRLIKGLFDDLLYKKIVKWNRFTAVAERALGFYLHDFEQRGLFKKYGFSSTVHFAFIKLQLPPKKTRELIRTARTLEDLPLTDQAFSDGKLSWSAVREITRVATRETEKEWIEFAQNKNLRQIERAVSRARHGERPPKDPYSLSRTKFKVVADLPTEDYAVWQAAFERLSATCGSELDASTVLVILARSFLERSLNDREMETRKAFQVVYHRCSECHRAWIQSSEGPEGIPPSRVAEREREAEVIRLDEEEGGKALAGQDVPRGTQEEGGRSLESSAPYSKEDFDKPNTALIRHQVLTRDGQTCATPGCQNRGELFAHHVQWRSNGGRTNLINEVSVCQRCHSLIHEGYLQVEGIAPYGLLWNGRNGKIQDGSELEQMHERFVYGLERRACVPRGTEEERGRSPEASVSYSGATEKDTTIYSLDQVPDRVDSKWWQKYGHNFIFKGKRAHLKHARI